MNVIVAFDVDGTLDISGGRIPVRHLLDLKRSGLIVGVVGNWKLAFERVKGLDFYQAGIPSKAEILKALGEEKAFRLYVGDLESDKAEADKAGWNFIFASDYKFSMTDEHTQTHNCLW